MVVASTSPTKRARGPFTRREGSQCPVFIWALILSNILVFQFVCLNRDLFGSDFMPMIPNTVPQQVASPASSSYVLDYPRGTAVALPSVRVSEEEERNVKREIYGGKGDKKHLGGFTEIDLHGISPSVWKYMVTYFGVKSLLDVGCGRGISTSWFALHGVDALCVEGSHDAVTQSILPDPSTQVVEHDFSRGPWWPTRTVDAVWCVEFLEHVGRNFHHNYLPAFRKAALIFATNSRWGGWHHVEVHDDIWWISKFESYGFIYSAELSQVVKTIALREFNSNITSMTGQPYDAQHVRSTMKVFINPAVAALPEHAHLFAEHGCYDHINSLPGQPIKHRECGKPMGRNTGESESRMPKSFYPIELTDTMDKAWENMVKKNIKAP